MSRAKTLLLAGFAVVAVSAAIASAALATEDWKVEKTLLAPGTSVGLASLPKIDLSLILHLTAGTVPILILCDSLHLLFAHLLWPNTDLAILDFLNCHTIAPTPTNCLILEQATKPLGHLIIAHVLSRQVGTRSIYTPVTGKEFTKIPFEEGTACVLEGEEPVKGSVVAATPTIHEELKEQALEGLGSTENNSLEVGTGNKAFLLGKVLLALESGEKWSFG